MGLLVPGRPAVRILLSDEIKDFAEHKDVRSFAEPNLKGRFAEQILNKYGILLNNRQKIVEKKLKKSELFFLSPK